MYCATEIGLISIHGQSRRSRVGILSKRLRRDIILPPLFIARLSMPISEAAEQALPATGIFAESRAASSCTVSREKRSVSSLNCTIRSFRLLLLKPFSRSSSCIIASASW